MQEKELNEMTLDELIAIAREFNLIPHLTVHSGCIELNHNGECVLLDPYQSRLFLRAVVRDFYFSWIKNRKKLPFA